MSRPGGTLLSQTPRHSTRSDDVVRKGDGGVHAMTHAKQGRSGRLALGRRRTWRDAADELGDGARPSTRAASVMISRREARQGLVRGEHSYKLRRCRVGPARGRAGLSFSSSEAHCGARGWCRRCALAAWGRPGARLRVRKVVGAAGAAASLGMAPGNGGQLRCETHVKTSGAIGRYERIGVGSLFILHYFDRERTLYTARRPQNITLRGLLTNLAPAA